MEFQKYIPRRYTDPPVSIIFLSDNDTSASPSRIQLLSLSIYLIEHIEIRVSDSSLIRIYSHSLASYCFSMHHQDYPYKFHPLSISEDLRLYVRLMSTQRLRSVEASIYDSGDGYQVLSMRVFLFGDEEKFERVGSKVRLGCVCG